MTLVRHLITLASIAALVCSMSWPRHALGGSDLDVLTPGASVQPNVLLIFDNSGSMNSPIPYQPTATYTGSFAANTVYSRCTTWSGSCQCTGSNPSTPTTNWKALTHSCGFVDVNSDGQDDRFTNSDYVKKGNRLNYEASPGSTKLVIAKAAVDALLADPANDPIRFGLMVLNGVEIMTGSCTQSATLYHNDKTIMKALMGTSHTTLRATVAALIGNNGTPLAPRLIAGARYFKKDGYFTGADPVQYACQRNFIVLMTDGRPSGEGDTLNTDFAGEYDYVENWLGQPWDYDGDALDPDAAHTTQPSFCALTTNCGRQSNTSDLEPCEYVDGGSDYLDDVSKKIFDQDLRADLAGKQIIATYTIGFTVANSLLQRTATKGGGEYFTANSAAELNAAFKGALKSIISNVESFVAPVVPLSQTTKTRSGDDAYLAFFRPRETGFQWQGNLKKYNIADDGALIDADGHAFTDSTGAIKSTARSYWEATASGTNVAKGGVGELLRTRVTARNIYTNLSGTNLTATANRFATTNAAITNATLGVSSTALRDKLINFTHGIDTYDEDADTNITEKRDWLLGDMIHSAPLVVPYSATDKMILVGANDGMLHAFDDTSGAELWAFIPDIHLGRLKLLPPGGSATHPFFVDGSPKLRVLSNGQKIVVFGMGRGGRAYYALDVTTKTSPQLLWKTTNTTNSNWNELGETWSDPVFTKYNGVESVMFSAGYDAYFDDPNKDTGNTSSPMGRAIYVAQLVSGAFTAKIKPTGMDFAIPSNLAVLDINGDGAFDRAWVGDLGGNMWRINGATLTATKLFSTPTSGGSKGQRIFFPPDIVRNQGYIAVFFGTGDRSNPLDTRVRNSMYAIKDDGTTGNLTVTNLQDVTTTVHQNGSSQEAALLTTLKSKKGWYVQLDQNAGEKVLASPSAFFSIYFTTFSPLTGACDSGGDARVYGLNEATGGIPDTITDPDGDGPLAPITVSRALRGTKVGIGIPTQVRLTIQKDKSSGYVGSSGQIDRVALPTFPNNVTPISWRECSTVTPCN